MQILHPNKSEFENLIKEDNLIVVDFFATWCGPCKMFGPILEEVASNTASGVKFAKIDIDENEDLALEYNVQAVPTISLFKNGKEVERKTGMVSKQELQDLIESQK